MNSYIKDINEVKREVIDFMNQHIAEMRTLNNKLVCYVNGEIERFEEQTRAIELCFFGS